MKTDYIKHKINNIINIQNIVTLHYFEFDRDFHFKGESHDFWEMVYADKGPLQITAGGKDITLSPGECYFHKPNEFHTQKANGINAPNVFVITFVCSSLSMNFFKSQHIKVPQKLKLLISNMIDEGKKTFVLPFNNPDLKQLQLLENSILGGQQMIRTYLEQFLILLLRECSGTSTKPPVAKDAVSENLAERMVSRLNASVYEKLTVEKFCQDMSYSKAYLSKIFSKNYDCTINEYITKVKIAEAKRLIREHSHNFSQISDMLCFSNPLYFSRVFRRVTGMSPSEYKNSVKID